MTSRGTAVAAVAAVALDSAAGWTEHAAALVANPVMAPLLLSIGFLGLLAEIRTPRFGAAGAAGLLALALFFASHAVVGLASAGDVLLFLVGLVLLGLEIFVIPGFGVVGWSGGLAVLTSVYLSLVGPSPPASDVLRAALVVVASVALTAVAAWALLRSLPAPARPGGHGIFLPHRALSGSGDSALAAERGRRSLVGREGSTITDLEPSGTAVFGEEHVEVMAESGRIPAGTAVRVVDAGGYRRVVRRIDEAGPGA